MSRKKAESVDRFALCTLKRMLSDAQRMMSPPVAKRVLYTGVEAVDGVISIEGAEIRRYSEWK